jgi:hypothetical protein
MSARWFISVFVLACVSSLLFLSIRAVLKPPVPHETHHTSEIYGTSKIRGKLVSDIKRNGNVSTYHHSLTDQPDNEYHGQIYDQSRYPLLYRSILQHEESAAFGIHSGKGYEHTSNLKKHLNDLRMKKNKIKRRITSEHSGYSGAHSDSHSDEYDDPLVHTTVTYTEPNGFHVNLDVNIAVTRFKTAEIPCRCENAETSDNNIKYNNDKNNNNNNNHEKQKKKNMNALYSHESSNKCVKTRNLAVVFFLPKGCYADQQEIEVRRGRTPLRKYHLVNQPITLPPFLPHSTVLYFTLLYSTLPYSTLP